MQRRELFGKTLGTLFSLPLLRGAVGNEGSFVKSANVLGEYRFTKLSSPTFGMTHLLKNIDLETGIVANRLGLGVIIISTRGIYYGDDINANL